MESQAFLANPTIRSFRKKYISNQSLAAGSMFGTSGSFGLHKSHYKNHHVFSQFSHDFLRETMIFLGQLPSNPQHPTSFQIFQATPVASSSMASRVRRLTPRAGRSPELVQLLGNIQYQWCRIMGFIWENLCRIWMESTWDLNGIYREFHPSTTMIFDVENGSNQEPEALSANGLPALRLMHAMRSPPELNVEFGGPSGENLGILQCLWILMQYSNQLWHLEIDGYIYILYYIIYIYYIIYMLYINTNDPWVLYMH